MRFTNSLVLMGSLAQAHYTIPRANANGVTTTDWEVVRKTANYQSNGPVTDVSSDAMTCYQLADGSEGATVLDVTAGGTVTFDISPDIYHPGPVNVYMAKAPSSVTDFDGKGDVFFKIYNDGPTVGSSGLVWPSDGITSLDVDIPACIEDGEYLIRFEHIALHAASTSGGAQLYISCAQVSVTGGSGTASPTLMAFPGAYTASDPGLLVNIYYPVPTDYKAPGGDPLQC